MTLDPGAEPGKRKMSILGNLGGGETPGGPVNPFMNKIMGKLHEGVKARVQKEAEENLSRVEEEDEENDLYKIKEVRDLTECRTSDQFLNLISH